MFQAMVMSGPDPKKTPFQQVAFESAEERQEYVESTDVWFYLFPEHESWYPRKGGAWRTGGKGRLGDVW